MSVIQQAVTRLLTVTEPDRVFTYPGSPPRYVYKTVADAGIEIETCVREQHLLHLAQTGYFQGLEDGEEQIPVVIVSADLGEAMLSQPLLAGSISCPCVVIVAEEAFPHVDNSANIAHQTDRATTHQKVDDREQIRRHENVADRILVTGENDIKAVEEVVETVREQESVGVIHLPLYAEDEIGTEFESIERYRPSTLTTAQFTAVWETAERRLFIVGRGIRQPGARERIASIAERSGVPIATTLQTDGYFETNHVGRIGTVGTPSANEAFFQADLVVALGTSMNNLLTSYDPDTIETFQSKTIQVDKNPRRRSVFVESWVPQDVTALLDAVAWGRADPWFEHQYDIGERRELVPDPVQTLADSIRRHCPESVVTLGVGNAMIWMTYALGPQMRKDVSRSGSMGEVVSGLSWGETPILVLGDGEFEMDLSLITEAQHQETSPIICIVNNGRLGLVTERQESEFGKRLTSKVNSPIDYGRLDHAFNGVESFTPESPQGIENAFKAAVETTDVSIIEITTTERLSNEIFDISVLPRVHAESPHRSD